MTLETLRERRAEVLEVARRRGAKAVWVFGSVARGEATPASDIDFLFEFEPGRSPLDQVHLIDELRSLLGTPVEVVATGGLLERDNHILVEAVPLRPEATSTASRHPRRRPEALRPTHHRRSMPGSKTKTSGSSPNGSSRSSAKPPGQ